MDGVLIYPVKQGENTIERAFICKNYALGKVLEHLKITVSDLIEGGYFTPDSNAGVLMETVLLFMYHSAVFAAMKVGKPVDFTLADCYDWVDNDGGLSGKLYADFSALTLASLGFKVTDTPEEVKPEKKSKAKSSNGKKS